MSKTKNSSGNAVTFPEEQPNDKSFNNHIIQDNLEKNKVLTRVANWSNKLLNDNEYQDIMELIQEKWGFSKEFINEIKIGFFPILGRGLKEWVRERSIDFSLIRKTGLVNNGDYDHFRGRILFPYWKEGEVVYFIGRKTNRTPNTDYEKAKYKKLLTKSHKYPQVIVENDTFAGEDSVQEGESLIITEGIADCYRAIEEGFNCVSPVTTRFREDDFPKIYQLSLRADKVYIANDSEESGNGLKGAEKTAEYLAERGIDVRVVQLPRDEGVEKVDLADFLTENSAEDFKELMDKTPVYQLQSKVKEKDYDEDGESIFDEVKKNVSILEVWEEFGDGQDAEYGNICCPFHDDNTPSMSIKVEENYFNCFGCSTGGDAIKLVELLENINPIEAAKMIAERFNLDINFNEKIDVVSREEREELTSIFQEYLQVAKDSFTKEHINILESEYGLSKEVIKRKQIGFIKDYTTVKNLAEVELRKTVDGSSKEILSNCFIIPYFDKGVPVYLVGMTPKGDFIRPNKVLPEVIFANLKQRDKLYVFNNEIKALTHQNIDYVLEQDLHFIENIDEYEEVVLIESEDAAKSLLRKNIFPLFQEDLNSRSQGFLESKIDKITSFSIGIKAVEFVKNSLYPLLALVDNEYRNYYVEMIRKTLSSINGLSKSTLGKAEMREGISEHKIDLDLDDPWFDENKFKPAVLAEEISEYHYFLALGSEGTPDRFSLYQYQDGVYLPGEKRINKILQREEWFGEDWEKKYVEDTISYLKRSNAENTIDLVDKYTSKFGHLINIKNGMLDLKSNKLLNHDPVYRSLNQMDVEYDPDAYCKRLDEFIGEVLLSASNPDKNKIYLFWEFVGWTIYSGDINLKKILFLVGEGNNGKSQLLSVIRHLLGKRNISSLKLKTIAEDQFAPANLFGKLANINGDLDSTDLQETSLIKQITGGDLIESDRKYKSRLKFKNRAKMIFALNDLPRIKDYSNAFFDRLIILRTPNTFTPDDPNYDPNIEKKVTTEKAKSYAFNKALEGLRRLMSNDWQFTNCESSEAEINDYIAYANPIVAFLKECCDEKVGEKISTETLYHFYKIWCKINNFRPCSVSNFGKRLKKNKYIIAKNTKVNQKRGWLNIKIKNRINEKYTRIDI